MAFSDPQTVTVSGTANTLNRVSSGAGVGAFANADQTLILDIRNAYGKRTRRTIGLDSKKLASDPLTPTQNIPVRAGIRLVVDAPIQGYTAADLEALVVGFFASLTAGTNANLKRLLGGEM